METKKRIFKEILERVLIPEGISEEKEYALLKPIIDYVHKIMPSRLFRYRECSERQFDAFYNDKVYAVNAKMFNDPYDCLIKYDKKYLYSTIEAGASKELIKQLRDRLRKGEPFPEFLASLYGEELTKLLKDVICNITDEELNKKKSTFELNKKELFKYVEIVLKQAEDYLRRNTFIACFSETVKSITMWSHYANSHKGFVLEYNFQNLNYKCDTCVKRDFCHDKLIFNLFPIIYDNKRYDATSFVEYYLGLSLGFHPMMNDKMYFTKTALYKSPQWKYEKEWRLFLNNNNSTKASCLDMQIKPVAIYYGNDISSVNKNILSKMAKEKGIKEYQMYVDVQSQEYTMKYRKV